MNRIIPFFAMAAVLLTLFVGCTKEEVDNNTFKVTFNSNGGNIVKPQIVTKGEKAKEPATPTKKNHIFAGWFIDNSTFNNRVMFPYTVTDNITLYANWHTSGIAHTYATFYFNLPATTRAIAQFNPMGVTTDDVADARINYGDLYLLVYNDRTGILEYTRKIDINNTSISATGTYIHTALLTAGVKKIFVLANLGDVLNTNNVMNHLETIPFANRENHLTVGTPVTWANLEEPTGSIVKLAGLYDVVFNAGTPQKYNVDKTANSYNFNTKPLSTRVKSGANGLAMTNSNRNSFTLLGGMTLADAEDTAIVPSTSGTNSHNRFLIEFDYLVAKARLVMNISKFPQTIADISDPFYSIKNLAKYTTLIQNYTSTCPQSYFHNFNWGNNAVQADFDPYFDQSMNLYEGASGSGLPVPTSGGPFIFVPENTNRNLLRGQVSFYAMYLTYKPKHIVKAVKYNNLYSSGSIAFPATLFDSWDNLAALPAGTQGRLQNGNQYIYYAVGIPGINNSTTNNAAAITVKFFANARVFADALWSSKNNKPLTDASYSTSAADALFNTLNAGTDYLVFTDARSFYRIDIGDGVGDSAFGVFRSKAYTATINDIAGPGFPTEKELFMDPDVPVKERTFSNITIEAVDWKPMRQ